MKCLRAFLYVQSFIVVLANETSAIVSLDGCLSIEQVDDGTVHSELVAISQPQFTEFSSIHMRIASLCNTNITKYDGAYLDRIVDLSVENVPLTSTVLYSIANKVTRLRTLSLVNASLIELLDFSFENLKNLTRLVITGNQIRNVTSAVFHGLDSLQVLTLSNNNIMQLAEDCFSDLVNLEELRLNENYIRKLHEFEDIFANNKNLKVLNLNKYTKDPGVTFKIAANIFKENRNLETLDLQGNIISDMSSDIFANLTRLKTLDLSANAFDSVKRDWFKSLQNLEVLNFERNTHAFNPSQFGHLKSLKILSLKYNLKQNTTKESFAGFPSLETLTLNGISLNNLTSSEARLFAGNPKLRNISLIDCSISRFSTASFLDLPELETVDMSLNKLSYLNYTELYRMTKHRNNVTFHLKGNRITRFYFRSSENVLMSNANGSKVIVHLDRLDHSTARCDFEYVKNYIAAQNIVQREVLLIEHEKLSNRKQSKALRFASNTTSCECEGDYSPCSCYYQNNSIIINCHNLAENSRFTWWPLLDSYRDYSISMDLSNGDLKTLPEGDWQFDSRIIQVNTRGNQLDHYALQLNWTDMFPRLQSFDLGNNKLQQIPAEFSEFITEKSDGDLTIYLDRNNLRCNCADSVWLSKLTTNVTDFIHEFENLACVFQENGTASLTWAAINMTENCLAEHRANGKFGASFTLPALISVVVIAAVLLVCLAAVWISKRRRSRQSHFISNLQSEAQLPLLKYDAFISYSHKDEAFVLNDLVPNLENPADCSKKYKLCLHERDWLAGEWILDQINRSIATSHRTIIVLSENFMDSFWGQHEFRIAYQQVIKSKQRKLIVIVKDEVPDLAPLDEELRYFIANNTYLKWSDPSFWRRLREALPDTQAKICT